MPRPKRKVQTSSTCPKADAGVAAAGSILPAPTAENASANRTEPEHCPGCAGRGAITVNLGPACRYREECQICGGSGSYIDAMTRILDGSAAQFPWSGITKEKIERFKVLARGQ